MTDREILELILKNQQETNNRLGTLESDFKGLKKDMREVKADLKGVWQDILKLDNRISEIEDKRAV